MYTDNKRPKGCLLFGQIINIEFFFMMLIIYADNKRSKGSLLFGQIINIEPSIYIFIYFYLIMRALIGPKEDYCLAN